MSYGINRSAWPAAVACVSFCSVTIILLQAYGILHWKIIHDNFPGLREPMRAGLFHLLGFLEVYHLTAALAVAFGGVDLLGRAALASLGVLAFRPVVAADGHSGNVN
jgi:hypothetical protein